MSNKRFSCDLVLDPDSDLAIVAEFLNQKSKPRRDYLEKALVSFYLPEAILNLSLNKTLTSQEEWQLYQAIRDLETQLKLCQRFFGSQVSNRQEQGFQQVIPQVEEAAVEITQASQKPGELSDDDDFDDAGI